jgi:hypothetical protein
MGEQRPPPDNYVCHICGKGGHWIADCPNQNGATSASGSDPKRLRTMHGIPTSKLQKVESSDAQAAGGTFMLPGGGFATIVPDEFVFSLFRSSIQIKFASTESLLRASAPDSRLRVRPLAPGLSLPTIALEPSQLFNKLSYIFIGKPF